MKVRSRLVPFIGGALVCAVALRLSGQQGIADGPLVGFYKDGAKKYEARISAGVPDGEVTEWYENGQVRMRMNFSKGKLHGERIEYGADGAKKRMEVYADGVLKESVNYEDGAGAAIQSYVMSMFPVARTERETPRTTAPKPNSGTAGRSGPTVSEKPAETRTGAATGTGWFCEGGYVVTCNHVVEGRNVFSVASKFLSKSPAPARIVARDKAHDIAVLELEDDTIANAALPLSEQKTVLGEKIFTIGFPMPGMMGKEPKVTDGTVSALSGIKDDEVTLQISVPIQPGNSGGPLMNMKGEVIGITSSGLSAGYVFEKAGHVPQNVNYAVKIEYMKTVMAQVKNKRTGAVLPNNQAELTDLAVRIQPAIVMVIAK